MSESEQGDAIEVRRARDGDASAFGVLVRRYQDRIYRHLLQLTGSREDALELVQETFIKAWQALPEWRPEAQFHTWLYRIASNAALDVLRRRKVVGFVPLPDEHEEASAAPGPETLLDAKQSVIALDHALARLTPQQREILLLREVEGLSYDELSAVLALDAGTVKSRLARARAALAAAWKGNRR
jgi:RNA polymerase sigma-70 factor (ECF subfamily)